LAILVCAIVAGGAIWLVSAFWRGGGCIGSEAERAVVAKLLDDPLLAGPPGATKTADSIKYIRCRTANNDPGDSGQIQPAPPPIAAQIVRAYDLANPMTAVELHDFHAAVDRPWRLTYTEANKLSYCRVLDGYRVVSMMTVNDRRLATETIVWTDAAGCAAEIQLKR
jgi:hypothetical protein